MNQAAVRVATAAVRAWTRLYTWCLPTDARDARRREIESDLWRARTMSIPTAHCRPKTSGCASPADSLTMCGGERRRSPRRPVCVPRGDHPRSRHRDRAVDGQRRDTARGSASTTGPSETRCDAGAGASTSTSTATPVSPAELQAGSRRPMSQIVRRLTFRRKDTLSTRIIGMSLGVVAALSGGYDSCG